MYRIKQGKPMTASLVAQYIRMDYIRSVQRKKLRDYYKGKHAILDRAYADPSKPNNRVVSAFPRYITDSYTGYFMGTPVAYGSAEEPLAEFITDVTSYNDDAAENSKLAREASITGSACECCYLDNDKEIRYTILEGDFIPVYDDTIEAELLWVIRYYSVYDPEQNRDTWFVDVYGQKDITHYSGTNPQSDLHLIGTEPHYWGLTPCAVYYNNPEELGDFEPVLSLVDAYDAVVSDTVNDMDYFTDAYLALKGCSIEPEDVQTMKTNRVICLPEGADAGFLVKAGNDTTAENLKNRLQNDIHKFSGCPDMSDESFGNNASGVSLRYKLMSMENISSTKERMFKEGLQRRFELIANMSALQGMGAFDYRDIDITFKRTLPVDERAAVDTVNAIGGLLSDATKIAMLPYDIDPAAEAERKRQETAETNALYFGGDSQFYDNRQGLAE